MLPEARVHVLTKTQHNQLIKLGFYRASASVNERYFFCPSRTQYKPSIQFKVLNVC